MELLNDNLKQCEFIVSNQDFNETVNPRFKAWLLATNKRVGDTWVTYEFMAWITRKSNEFKNLKDMDEALPIYHIENGHNKFTDFLFK